MNTSTFATVLACVFTLALVTPSEGYKHVVFMHGILSGPEEFDFFHNLVEKYHPGTPITQVDMYNNLDSVVNLVRQLDAITKKVGPILTNTSSEGTILICYSQGGVICRGLLSFLQHNVETFIALSSPLAGQFGDTDYLKLLFPHYIKENLYKVFYTTSGQDISVGNYWYDPHQGQLYKKFSTFLALLNNQSDTVNPKSQEYKENFLRLKNMVLVGGPNDGVITPWQSSQFGMYNASEVVLPMAEQEWYQNDAFGLKTLDSQGRIHIHTMPNVQHVTWYKREDVFEKCVKPWLS